MCTGTTVRRCLQPPAHGIQGAIKSSALFPASFPSFTLHALETQSKAAETLPSQSPNQQTLNPKCKEATHPTRKPTRITSMDLCRSRTSFSMVIALEGGALGHLEVRVQAKGICQIQSRGSAGRPCGRAAARKASKSWALLERLKRICRFLESHTTHPTATTQHNRGASQFVLC